VALVEFINPVLFDIEANHRIFFGKFNREGKAYITEADNGNFRRYHRVCKRLAKDKPRREIVPVEVGEENIWRIELTFSGIHASNCPPGVGEI